MTFITSLPLTVIGLVAISIGEILLAFTVITVHNHIIKEHKIDAVVLRVMKSEKRVALYGLVLITFGTLLQIVDHLYI